MPVNGQGGFIDDVTVDGFSDDFEGGDPFAARNWLTNGWSWTTGLFANNWLVAYAVPVFDRGTTHTDYGHLSPLGTADGSTYFYGEADTSNLNGNNAMVVFANRSVAPFDAGYLLLVDKVDAGVN